jgi:hypothetical protein
VRFLDVAAMRFTQCCDPDAKRKYGQFIHIHDIPHHPVSLAALFTASQ